MIASNVLMLSAPDSDCWNFFSGFDDDEDLALTESQFGKNMWVYDSSNNFWKYSLLLGILTKEGFYNSLFKAGDNYNVNW